VGAFARLGGQPRVGLGNRRYGIMISFRTESIDCSLVGLILEALDIA
jgi:hypothetical protein